MNQLRRGFSSPGFEQGRQSEFDMAVEVGAKAIYEFEPHLNQGLPVPWDGLNEHVRVRERQRACVVLEAVRQLMRAA